MTKNVEKTRILHPFIIPLNFLIDALISSLLSLHYHFHGALFTLEFIWYFEFDNAFNSFLRYINFMQNKTANRIMYFLTYITTRCKY